MLSHTLHACRRQALRDALPQCENIKRFGPSGKTVASCSKSSAKSTMASRVCWLTGQHEHLRPRTLHEQAFHHTGQTPYSFDCSPLYYADQCCQAQWQKSLILLEILPLFIPKFSKRLGSVNVTICYLNGGFACVGGVRIYTSPDVCNLIFPIAVSTRHQLPTSCAQNDVVDGFYGVLDVQLANNNASAAILSHFYIGRGFNTHTRRSSIAAK